MACLIMAACSTGTSATGTEAGSTSSAGTMASGSPAEVGKGAIQGTFDVGGHKLYLNCAGTGTPTIIYMHGSIVEPSVDPHINGMEIQSRLREDHRVCVYDRRNLAHSDKVDAPQSPDDAMSDLQNLLATAEVEPPYVLLGASFGGLLSYLYANLHPDEVVGMVLLDSMFPDELSLDHLFPPEERFEAFNDEDETSSLERISHFKVLEAASQYIGKEPAIPVTYLASRQEPYDENDYGLPEYDGAILDLQAAFVDRFTPGNLVWVDAPHFMEPAVSQEIADALRDVIRSAGYS